MADEKDPLENLLLDAQEVDRAKLAAALKGILGVDTKTGRVVPMPGFVKLTSRQKLLAYLLGRKVANLLGKLEIEPVSAKDVQADTRLPRGTVSPKLRELFDDKLASQNAEGQYYIGVHQISLAIDNLRREEKV